jgi:hypothetical protein
LLQRFERTNLPKPWRRLAREGAGKLSDQHGGKWQRERRPMLRDGKAPEEVAK